jgi:hypothetical protein
MRLSWLFPILFLGLFLAIGLGLLGYGLWMVKRSGEAAYWPIAPGTLSECNLSQRAGSKGGTTYEVTVKYRYNVAGQNYDGTRIAFGYLGSNGRDTHAAIHERLAGAQQIEVRYDPADPATAVLSYGTHRTIQFMLAFACTWLAFVSGFIFLWYLSTRPDDVLLQNLLVR